MIAALALVGAIAQAAASPAPTASPEPTPTPVAGSASSIVRVPEGWRSRSWGSQTKAYRRLGEWLSPGGDESLELSVSGNYGLDARAFGARVLESMRKTIPSATTVANGPVVLCGGAAGWEVAIENGDRTVLDVFGATRARMYDLSYQFVGEGSAQGRAASASLCPPPDPALAEQGRPPIAAPPAWTPADLSVAPVASAGQSWVWYGPRNGAIAPTVTAFVNAWKNEYGSIGVSGFFEGALKRFFGAGLELSQPAATRVCGRYDGVAVHASFSRDGSSYLIDSVMTIAGGLAYGAMYVRVKDDPTTAVGLTAIRSLCPPKT